MDQFDTYLVEYMLAWAPFGGPPPEDAFPRFGMNIDQLWVRFDEIIRRDAQMSHQFSSDIRDALDKVSDVAAPPDGATQPDHSVQPTPPKSPDSLDFLEGQWNLHRGVRVWTPRQPNSARRSCRDNEASSL